MRQKRDPQMSLFMTHTNTKIGKELEQMSGILDDTPELLLDLADAAEHAEVGRVGLDPFDELGVYLSQTRIAHRQVLLQPFGEVLYAAQLDVRGAELDPIQAGAKQGKFTVKVSCTDNVTEECELSADINGVPVSDGDVVQLVVNPGKQTVETVPGTGVLKIKAPSFVLAVTCTDEAGNSTTVTVEPEFREPGRRP